MAPASLAAASNRPIRRLRRYFRRNPITIRSLRLWTGLVLTLFVASHFVNHALGLVSLPAMEAGRIWFLAVWRSGPGTVVLMLSLIVHILLALLAIYARRSLRMSWAEVIQLLLGLATPPLIIIHLVGTRGAHQMFGVEDTYAFVLWQLWVEGGGVRQIVASMVVWVHACIGIYFWLHLKPWYARALPYLYGTALLLPVVSMLGYVAGGRRVAQLAAEEGWTETLFTAANITDMDLVHDTVLSVEDVLLRIFVGLLALTLIARLVRQLAERWRGRVRITYPNGRRVQVVRGPTLLEVSRIHGIPHASVCGGRGRCSTCRIRINTGGEHLEEPSPAEQKVLDRIRAAPDVRLACQLRPTHDLSVTPLLPPNVGPQQGFRKTDAHQGREQEIAVLFADIRGFTTISEAKLPYDVVFILNRYFRSMGEAIESAGGRVDKFIGDGIMALFGVDSGPRRGCADAVRAARAMSEQLENLNGLLNADLPSELRIGIGIHAGPAIVGEMGYAASTSVTAIGDTVNTASRLEAMTKEFEAQLIMSQRVVDLAGIDMNGWPSEDRPVRGRTEPLTIRIVKDARNLPEPQARRRSTRQTTQSEAIA